MDIVHCIQITDIHTYLTSARRWRSPRRIGLWLFVKKISKSKFFFSWFFFFYFSVFNVAFFHLYVCLVFSIVECMSAFIFLVRLMSLSDLMKHLELFSFILLILIIWAIINMVLFVLFLITSFTVSGFTYSRNWLYTKEFL